MGTLFPVTCPDSDFPCFYLFNNLINAIAEITDEKLFELESVELTMGTVVDRNFYNTVYVSYPKLEFWIGLLNRCDIGQGFSCGHHASRMLIYV